MPPKLSLLIFNEIEDVKEDTFDVINQKPKKVAPEKHKAAAVKGFRFFKHPVFLITRALFLLIPFLLILIGVQMIPSDQLSLINKSFLSFTTIFAYVILLLRNYVYWRINSYLIVPEEGLYIFKAKGLFSLSSENVPFNKISTFDHNKSGFGSQIFGYGDIMLASIITNKETGAGANIVLKKILNPRQVIAQMKKLAHNDEDHSTSETL